MVVDDPPLPPPPPVVVTHVPEPPKEGAPTTAEPERIPPAVKDEDAAIRVVNGELQDAFFAYDRYAISPEALTALRHDVGLLRAILADFPGIRIVVEGHCDERGSAEYNMALGDQRAERAVEVLEQAGIPKASIDVVSYGKEAPQCTEETESCWQKNRRAHPIVRK